MFDPYASFQRPASFRPAPRGYYIVKQLLIVGAITGSLVALYRNDVFRDLARRGGQEHRYLAAEKFLVGTPGWGTPRSMEPVLAGKEIAPPSAPVAEPAPIAAAPVEPAPVARPAAPPAAPAPPVVAGAAAPNAASALVPVPVSALEPVDPLKPVSLDSLPVAGGAAKTVSLDDLSPARAQAPSRPAPAPNARAMNISLDEPSKPAAAKPVAAKPAPPPPKPAEPERPKATEARPNDNPLTAAIRGAVRARPPKDTVPQ